MDPHNQAQISNIYELQFDQRKYKYISYVFLRNHYHEWVHVDCASCKEEGYRHNPFKTSCKTAKEIMRHLKVIMQNCQFTIDQRAKIGEQYGRDIRTAIVRAIHT